MSKITWKSAFSAVILASASLSLAGCITVLPKVKPAQLYRFGYSQPGLATPVAQASAGAGGDIGLVLGSLALPQDSSGDRILTVEGNEVSYVADARWTAPAQTLFNEALSDGFARSSKVIRLEPRAFGSARFRLDVSVRKFETDYSHGKATVSVTLDARILRLSDHAVMGQRFITAEVAPKHNEMSLITDSFNMATTQVISALIDFSQTTLKGQETPLTPSSVVPLTDKSDKQKAEGL